MKRVWTMALAVAAMLAVTASGKDTTTYPEGVSVQSFADHSFDLLVPKAADVKPPYSLLVVIAKGPDVDPDYLPFAREGYVVVAPMQKLKGGMWATSEAREVIDIVEHLQSALPIAKERTHVLTFADTYGFASFVAFDKRAKFVSYALVDTMLKGQSPPADARKRFGVLSMGKGDARRGDPAGIVESLAGKVRTVEHRPDDSPFGPYFRYWLGAMEGRFTPGYDLSFAWVQDASPAAVKPGAKDVPPQVKPAALDSAKASAKERGAAAFVYFWSADDAAKPEAKAMQNEMFFDAEVRAAAKELLAVKLERAKYEEAFAALGLKSTPAVAVVDRDFTVLERFEGAVTAKALAKSFAKAVASARAK
ncbi:MAG: hypothetical protein K8T90_14890 [Planctomycetes bacterium]|nr:hypothetical protein [Planctomycetota bacterium]